MRAKRYLYQLITLHKQILHRCTGRFCTGAQADFAPLHKQILHRAQADFARCKISSCNGELFKRNKT
jgi:hypothetical protein